MLQFRSLNIAISKSFDVWFFFQLTGTFLLTCILQLQSSYCVDPNRYQGWYLGWVGLLSTLITYGDYDVMSITLNVTICNIISTLVALHIISYGGYPVWNKLSIVTVCNKISTLATLSPLIYGDLPHMNQAINCNSLQQPYPTLTSNLRRRPYASQAFNCNNM